MGLLLWPSLEYHQFTKHVYQKLTPLFKQFEHSVEQSAYQARRPRGELHTLYQKQQLVL